MTKTSDRFEYEHASRSGRGQFYSILDYESGKVLCVVCGEEHAKMVVEALNLWHAFTRERNSERPVWDALDIT